MLKKTSFIFSILIICLLTITFVSAQDNATDELITQNIETPIITASENANFTQLSKDIENAEDTLELTQDYKYVTGDTVSNDGITIDKTLTINGNGHTIDASNAVRIFSVKASNVIFKNITFINANSQDRDGGSAIFTTSENTNVINCNFQNNYAYESGGAIRTTASGLTVEKSNFDSNSAVVSGGAIAVQLSGSNARIVDCNFTHNYVRLYGGALSIGASNALISNCNFEDNTATNIAGAIYINPSGSSTRLNRSTFKSNNAEIGGGVYNQANLFEITDSYFEDNSAIKHGGGIFVSARDCLVKNSEFVNNSAASGGGVYMVVSENSNTQYSYNMITDSEFVNNYARYGGGAVTATANAGISNSLFVNNTAGIYGGAVDLTNSRISSSELINNSAVFGGALYVQNANIVSSNFTNNNASVGNSIYVLNVASLIDNQVSDEDIYIYKDDAGAIIGNDHDIRNMLQTDDGYFAYCAEKFNSNPYTGVYDHSMEKLYNAINHQPVGEYLKILIYQYLDHMDDLRDHDFHDYVWAFTDYEYWASTDPIVKEVVSLYDSGFRVPNINACKVLSNGTLMYFNFSSMITPSGQQNLFLFKFAYGDEINETLTKEALNKTAYIGDYVEYRIVVSNKGTSPIYNVWIEDKDYSKGLLYESWHSEIGEWIYNNQTKHWNLAVLNPAKSASVILKFKVVDYGKLYNNASSGVGNVNVTNSTEDIYVYTPNFTVEKISLTERVELGDKTEFQIIVQNTGDLDLHEFFVEESSYDGLEYDSWYRNDHWTHSIVNGKHRWTFNGVFAKGEISAFIVIFKTTDYGNFTNVVVAGSNETDNKTTNNTTKVLKPDFVVEKHALTPYVLVGNQTLFQIIVRNIGEIDLDDIIVIEDSYEGLTFDHAEIGDVWTPLTINGKKAWKLNIILEQNSEEFFFVVFNTTRVGNFTNYVVATSNKTDNKTTNNTTVVNETIPKSGNFSNFTVEKITLTPIALIGELVEFQIIVKNTGNATIHNLTIYESKYDGLIYHRYVDHFNLWDFDENKMSWKLKNDFYPGEELGIHVYFNTTQVGKFTNYVVVTSNETDNKTSNNTTKVLKPGINIEKITINRTVNVGEQVMFEIVVHNYGETDLENVIVHELNFEGLVYDHFIDYTGFWSKNDDLSWSLNRILSHGEYEGFFVVFNTTKRGNFTNTVVVESNGTDNDTSNDTVEVLGYNLTVSKNTITKQVVVGKNTVFEIIVKNTGDFVLKNVFVIESKYDSGLVYLDYISKIGNWKHSLDNNGKHIFTLLNDLNVGDLASFRVIFKTIAVGNFTNTVEAGYNNTTLCNSTNITEVINKTTPEDLKKNNETIKKDKNNTNNSNHKTSVFKRQLGKNDTGNPLLVLIFVIILIPLRRFK